MKKKLLAILKRYSVFIALVLINAAIVAFFPATGLNALQITGKNALEMLLVLPAVFILLGLLDVWVKRETMIKLMGEKSRFLGVAIAFVLGSAAAGPLYTAFPIAAMLMKKGSKYSNVLIFLGAWSTTKIPMMLFEASSMGLPFMLLRFALNLPVIAVIAHVTQRAMKKEEIEEIYAKAEKMIQ